MLDKFFGNIFYRKHREKLLMMIDMMIVVFSYVFSYWIKDDFSLYGFKDIDFSTAVIFLLIVMIVYIISFLIFKVHKSLWKYINTNEVLSLSKANLLATMLVVIGTLIIRKDMSLLSLEIIAGILALLFMFTFRTIYRIYRSYTSKRASENSKNTIIIGAGDGGNLLFKELIQNPKLEYNVLGFIDDVKKNLLIAGKPILGTINDIHEIIENYNIEAVLIAIPSATRTELMTITNICEKEDVEVKMMNMTSVLDEESFDRSLPVQDIRIEDLLGRGEVKLEQEEIKSYIEGNTICVTGAGGSIGSELCRQITRFKPRKLILVDINENALYMLEQEFNRKKIHNKISTDIEIVSFIASIRDRDSIDEIMRNELPDVVYHAAAHKHVPLMETKPKEAIKNNVFGTNNVIQACIENKVKRFILISTDKAVNPTNVMGATKRMTELLLQANGKNGVTKMAAVRFGNVLGSNGSVIPIFKKQIEEGGPITITDKRITRYFMTIPEASQLVLQAGFYANCGEIFVLDMGEPVKIIDLAENLIKLSGFIPYKEIEIKEIGLRPGEKMFEELRLDDEMTSKTKNNLIFLNKSKDISLKKIDAVLKGLNSLISSTDNTSNIKKQLLDYIHMDMEGENNV
ncbi:polysaccharide biosynthesis protein [Breznakia pachnodae]|uniref:FlaA1/EpsC-like NDP-sugar epimerase n=1 Tax=Breznakia pachnodae TaxID=265178 RepID=A0ABU0DZ53_9FIRM|nr:nucleoside-diphosphate sugar epimerase/dehydratase [Breznakia pachnodae]MDQ0359820.1 FlaA1/EpsC-like NDP-sugar epimerase [Breznakia pachnodae]